MIRTPDQKLRVFISSTIQELSDERLAAREAIEGLRLTPVLFEIGARPYPPRDVYQAYLSQSDIFIGIYWNSYGWIAPDMDISGLEDEYQLSGHKPRLIYLKKSDTRQDRLNKLIEHMSLAGLSYRIFNTPGELKELIENDLALLLSEQFHADATEHGVTADPVFNQIPQPFHPLIGRETETKEITSLILVQKKRCITVLGMGGTGKTRLAIEIANQLLPKFKNGVIFVSLGAISDPSRVPLTIAHQLGLSDSTVQSVEETLFSFLSDKHLLLVLDNFEQLTEGATLLSNILGRSKETYLLITSRKPLYLRAEHIYPLNPLQLPGMDVPSLEKAMQIPSTALFIQRAQSVNARLSLDKENLQAISVLCDQLGGLPLALELAAMRTRYMNPVDLMKGMKRTLDILTDGAVDLPDRQQSFRATVDWSYNLLQEDEKFLFRVASVFRDGWTNDTLAVVSNKSNVECRKSIEQLLDAGLIRLQIDHAGVMRYDMLQPIAEFAEELLAEDKGVKDRVEVQFVNYFVDITRKVNSLRLTPQQHKEWTPIVITEYENFRQAFKCALHTGRRVDACRIVNALGIYWFREGLQNEGLRWIHEGQIAPPTDWRTLSDEDIRVYAYLMLISGSYKFFPAEFSAGMADLLIAREMFEAIRQLDGVARSNVYLGLTAISTGDQRGFEFFREAIENGTASGDTYSVLISSTFIAEVYAIQGKHDEAVTSIAHAEHLLDESPDLKSYSLERSDVAAVVYLEKGNIYLSKGDFDVAKESYERSLHYFDEAKTKSTQGYAVLSMGLIHLRDGDLTNANIYTFRALNDSRESGDKIISLLSMRGLCVFLLLKGYTDESLLYFSEVNAHLHNLRYSSWSVDIVSIGYIKDQFKQRNLVYDESLRDPKLSFDELIAQLTTAVRRIEAIPSAASQ